MREFARKIMEKKCQADNCEQKSHVRLNCTIRGNPRLNEKDWFSETSSQDSEETPEGEGKGNTNKKGPEYEQRTDKLIKLLLNDVEPAPKGTPGGKKAESLKIATLKLMAIRDGKDHDTETDGHTGLGPWKTRSEKREERKALRATTNNQQQKTWANQASNKPGEP